jgi:glycerol-3-phosphate O-acyltransferase 3/4
MTRWALVAEVWYLPPRNKRNDQTAVDFSNEVKAEISKRAGLRNLSMDGYFKVKIFNLYVEFCSSRRKTNKTTSKPSDTLRSCCSQPTEK